MPGDVTALLLAYQRGDSSALERVWSLVYEDLQAVAKRQLRSGAPATLNATALVHEAYLRLASDGRLSWQNRGHFLGIAARCMRRIIVDTARARNAAKRGGGRAPGVLNPDAVGLDSQYDLIVAIDIALESVATFNERMARVAECRLFGGLTDTETADALGMSLRTVQRDWHRARAWLQQQL